MRLFFLDSVDCKTFGGYENWILLTGDYLAKKGHEVTIAGRAGSEYLKRAAKLESKPDLVELNISGDFNPLTVNRIKQELLKRQIDIITVNFNKDVRLGGIASRLNGGTKVIWRQGLDMTGSGIVHRFITPKLIDGVIVPSYALKKQVMRRGYLPDDMIEVIHNGAAEKEIKKPDTAKEEALRRKYNLPSDSTIAVTVGRFVDQKGHIYLVDAATEIVAANPSVFFLLLGDGEHEMMLKQRIEKLGLSKHFIFCGMLDSIDLELSGSDLMIHPAIEEPFSHAILEGMRAGLPIVGSCVGGIPEAVIESKTAFLVEAKDIKALANAVNSMLSDPERMVTFGLKNQQRWRDNFTLTTMMEKVERYFNSMLN